MQVYGFEDCVDADNHLVSIIPYVREKNGDKSIPLKQIGHNNIFLQDVECQWNELPSSELIQVEIYSKPVYMGWQGSEATYSFSSVPESIY